MTQYSRDTQQILLTIQKRHEELLRQNDGSTEFVKREVQPFIERIAQEGRRIENSQERSVLRDFIGYWSAIVNEKTGEFPIVRLEPFDLSQIPRSSNLNLFRQPIRYYLLIAITIIIVVSAIIAFVLFRSSPTLPNATSLTPQEVQSWCSTTPYSSGTCNLSRFEQLVTNRHVNPKAVLMNKGGPVSFNVPAGITVDVWNCKETSTVPGPKKLNFVCQATFYLNLSSALRMKESIQIFYLSSFSASLGSLTKSGAERLENR